MKNLLFVFSMPDNGQYIGGVATVVNNYLLSKDRFVDNGYSISLFDYRDSRLEKIRVGGLKKVIFGIYQAKNLLDKVINEHVDIVHIHTSRNSLFIKDVLLGRFISIRSKTKVCLTIHVGDIATVYEKIPNNLKRLSINLLNKYFYKVFFLSHEIKNQFINHGLKENISCVLYNSCNITRISDTYISTDETFRVLFVGMINRDKGIIELLDAISNPLICDHIQCHICGEITDGSIREVFEEKYSKVKNNTHLHGYVTGREKAKLFSSCDVLVLPSYHEGFPIVILEGITCGCAIVATRVGAIPEILDDNNCIFVDVGSVKSIENALLTLINDRELLLTMKENNLKLSRKYALIEHIDRLCELYGE